MKLLHHLLGLRRPLVPVYEPLLPLSEHDKALVQRFVQMDVDSRIMRIIDAGESADLSEFPLLQFAIAADLDLHVKLAALRRIHLFYDHPRAVPMMTELKEKKVIQDLEPYLSIALQQFHLIDGDEFKRRIYEANNADA
ncbi:MAG: hypothetical protein H7Y03_11570 [Chitinophagaceae bacterium]|nr:hypothetical protein [Chitinophagaceae bacterium]